MQNLFAFKLILCWKGNKAALAYLFPVSLSLLCPFVSWRPGKTILCLSVFLSLGLPVGLPSSLSTIVSVSVCTSGLTGPNRQGHYFPIGFLMKLKQIWLQSCMAGARHAASLTQRSWGWNCWFANWFYNETEPYVTSELHGWDQAPPGRWSKSIPFWPRSDLWALEEATFAECPWSFMFFLYFWAYR